MHYDLREVGSSQVPENIPRPLSVVLSDLQQQQETGGPKYHLDNLDATSLQPAQWPRRHDASPREVRRDRIRSFVTEYLAQRPEQVICIVAHYNVIQTVLQHSESLVHSTTPRTNKEEQVVRPRDAIPIPCVLDATGIHLLQDEHQSIATPTTCQTPIAPPVDDMMEIEPSEDRPPLAVMHPVALEQAFASIPDPMLRLEEPS